MGRLHARRPGPPRASRCTRPRAYDGLQMPELPEVEVTARLLGRAIAGERIEYARVPGINALRSFEPPIEELVGQRVAAVRRRGKHLIVETDAGLALLIHLMSAGRLQLYDKPAGPRDRTSRMLLGLESGRELRLREFGSKQAAWVKPVSAAALEDEDPLASLGPEAWPEPPPLSELLDAPRPLHALLRDQHVIAGIGRSWVDEILWRSRAVAIQARLGPAGAGAGAPAGADPRDPRRGAGPLRVGALAADPGQAADAPDHPSPRG